MSAVVSLLLCRLKSTIKGLFNEISIYNMLKLLIILFRADKNVNWLSDYWLAAAYLSNRDPIAGTRIDFMHSHCVHRGLWHSR